MQPSKQRWVIKLKSPACENIFRNLPGNPKWEGSFYEQLSEHGRWDIDEFWILHLAITQTAKSLKQSDLIEKKLALNVVVLQSRIDQLFVAHFNKNDAYEILDLSVDELFAFKERFDLAVMGVFSGEVLPESSFELTNPLLRFP